MTQLRLEFRGVRLRAPYFWGYKKNGQPAEAWSPKSSHPLRDRQVF